MQVERDKGCVTLLGALFGLAIAVGSGGTAAPWALGGAFGGRGLAELSAEECPAPACVDDLSTSEGMSTRSFRRRLQKQGAALEGMDVDHIVPRSLGGADHPANYQLLPSGVNRSLQGSWTTAKCRAAGLGTCAAAMLVCKRCGSFAGPFF